MWRNFDPDERGLTIDTGSRSRRIVFSLVILAGIAPILPHACRVFRADLLSSSARTVEGYSRAIENAPGNAELWWIRGRLRHYSIENTDLAGAAQDYRRALSLNPRLGQAWVDLADCLDRTGDVPGAEESLRNALRVWTYSPIIRWQAGNFHLLRGDRERMYECFRMAVEYDIGKLEIAAQLAWRADPDHSGILSKLIPDTMPANLRYLNWLVARKEGQLARAAWDRVLRNPEPRGFRFSASLAFPLIDALLAGKRVEDALRVWDKALRKSGIGAGDRGPSKPGGDPAIAGSAANLVWNGSFEDDPLGGGFDWRYGDTGEVDMHLDSSERADGLRSLRIAFQGTNVAFSHLSQIVPIPAPGIYRLQYDLRTESLTTDRRPQFVIQEFPGSGGVLLEAESMPASAAWRRYSFPFKVGPGIGAVRLLMRRISSEKYDSRIQGSLWLDNVAVLPETWPGRVGGGAR